MNKIITTILLVYMSLVVSGQVVDFNKFDKKLFEKVLFEEVNQFRKSKGVDTVVFSEVLYKKLSDVNAKKMSESRKVAHFDFDVDTILSEVAIEAEKKYGGKVLRTFMGELTYKSISEIILRIPTNRGEKNITYKELAWIVIEGWKSSSGHEWIMSYSYESKGKSGLASCSTYIKDGNVYACFNFAELRRTLN